MAFKSMATRVAWAYLALVLLLAPVLGGMHGVIHGAGSFPQAAAMQGVAAASHGHGHAWVADLFSAHGGASDCRVFDQLSHSSPVPALPLLALPLVLSSFVFHVVEGEVVARWAALFEARGPPLAR
jgi:hypothetical protein